MNINTKVINDSSFIELWKKEMISTIKQMHPDWKKKQISDVIDEMLIKQMRVPDVTLDNNYTGEQRDSNMLSVFDWAINRKPLIAGNGTFYKNQHEAMNPIAKMLNGFLNERKSIKKEMFKVKDKTSDLYKDLDRAQLNVKILVNSYYGASGMPKSAFYSKYSGPATTGTAQSVISTTETFFEAFLMDNYKFIDINEAFHYMNEILSEDYKLDDFVIRITHEDLFEKIKNMFYDDVYEDKYEEILVGYIYNLSIDDATRIFYKNNLIEFTRRHIEVKSLYDKLFSSVKNFNYANSIDDIPKKILPDVLKDTDEETIEKYNKFVNNQYFMDPNSPPETVSKILEELNEIYIKYVYIPFMSVDRIHRLKYFPRKTVCVVDTDSNILALDIWVKFCKEELLKGDYGRSEENNRFIIINTLAYFITSTIGDTLNTYGIHSNIPDDYRHKFNMKNEFEIRLVILSNCGDVQLGLNY